MHYGDTHLKRRWRTKSRTKDLDQVCDSRVSSIITFKDFLAYLCDLMLSNECNEFHTINEVSGMRGMLQKVYLVVLFISSYNS